MLTAIRTATTDLAGTRRMALLLLMTLLFGLQSGATSAAIAKDVSHSFSVVEHQELSSGISRYHEGCSAQLSSAPELLLASALLVEHSSLTADLPLFHRVYTQCLELGLSQYSVEPLSRPPLAETAVISTPFLRQDILRI